MFFHAVARACKDMLTSVWRVFLSGFFTILPIALTIAIMRFAIVFVLDRFVPVGHFLANFGLFKRVFGWIPHGEFFFVLIIVLLIGLVMRNFAAQIIIGWAEGLVCKIPLVKLIYSSTKQMIETFGSADKDKSLNQVVLVEFPGPGIYSIGFLTGPVAPVLAQGQNMVNVFLPTTPNPTTGFYLIMPEQRVKRINISRQEAMVLIMSGGIVQPKTAPERQEAVS